LPGEELLGAYTEPLSGLQPVPVDPVVHMDSVGEDVIERLQGIVDLLLAPFGLVFTGLLVLARLFTLSVLLVLLRPLL
jgi:hypothetical protein